MKILGHVSISDCVRGLLKADLLPFGEIDLGGLFTLGARKKD
jgi:hypothetical protein